jgi:hypothetical protein
MRKKLVFSALDIMPKSISCLCATLVIGVVLSAQSANAMGRGGFGFGEGIGSGIGIGIGEQFSFVPSLGFVIGPPTAYDPYATYSYPHYNPVAPYPGISPDYSTMPNLWSQPGREPFGYSCDDPHSYYPFARTCDHVWLSFPLMPLFAPGS